MAYNFIPTTTDELQILETNHLDNIKEFFIELCSMSGMADPIAIDPKDPRAIKVHRGLTGAVDLKQFKAKYNLKLGFGNGSRGNRGTNNRGIGFENSIFKDLVNLKTGASEFRHPRFIEWFQKNLIGRKKFDVVLEGGSNKKRPLLFTEDGIFVGSRNGYIGPTVTDVTLQTRKNPIYLSLKYGPSVNMFNVGLAKILPKWEFDNGTIQNQQGLMLLETIGVDPARVVDMYKSYKPNQNSQTEYVDVTNTIDKTRLQNLLVSGVGHGYHLVHSKDLKSKKITHLYLDQEEVTKAVAPERITVAYPVNGTSKLISTYIETPRFTFKINIRNTKSKVHPSSMCCRYKVKDYAII